MFKKFIQRASRPLGIFLIFFFSVACILASLVARDIDESTFLGKVITYTVSFDNRFYDFRMKDLIDPRFKSKEQVLIEIDDHSLQKIGSWPIPRTKHAELIQKLKARGARVVAMDVLFPEASPSCSEDSPDNSLVEAFQNFKTDNSQAFISYTITVNPNDGLPEVPGELFDYMPNSKSVAGGNFKQVKVAKYNYPIRAFAESGVGLGFISIFQDRDGIYRQYFLTANVDDVYLSSLGLAAYDAYVAPSKKALITIQEDGDGTVTIENSNMETNNVGETKVRWIGGLAQFPRVSMYDFISTPDDDPKMTALVKDKIVFVGSTATGAHDLRPSPVDPEMPGVLIHMNMVHMLLHKYFYRPAEASVKLSILLLLLGSLIFWAASRLGYASVDLITLAAMIAASFYADRFYFLPEGYELKLFYCYLCFIASYSWNTFLNFSEANKEKKQVKGTFARYVAPTIVDEMLKDPEKLVVGGVRRDITCLFSDVRDFTSISEGLSPTELAHSLNIYMGKMTDIVFDTKGTLDKYIGDAIVAFWGAPFEIGNHAQYAVEGALKMMETLPAINEEFKRLGRPQFNVGIGLNSGECNVGNMGSSRIFSYTALGDNMNLGARLEGLCKYYGAQILISEYTLARIDTTTIKTRPVDNVVVKGKTTPVGVFEVLHANHFMTKDPEAYDFYTAAHGYFMKKNFSEAKKIFGQLRDAYPEDKSTGRFYEICERYLEHPETVTDQFYVTVMKEK